MPIAFSVRSFAAFGALALAGAAFAQQPIQTVILPMQAPTAIPNFATSAEIAAIITHAEGEMKPGQPVIIQPIHHFGSYTTYIEVRRGGWTAATHPDIELFYVVRGTGTLVLGGKIDDAKPGKGGNAAGTKISGGQTIKVGPGDFFYVPPETAHQFPAPDGELVLISMHLPKSDAPKP
jgi:mannose-6-phosphate isomerase-like protein (cupin superfamily)